MSLKINIYTFEKPITIWLTGLSGSGRSKIAKGLADYLKCQKIDCYILDGDKLRQGNNTHLGFLEERNVKKLLKKLEPDLLITLPV